MIIRELVYEVAETDYGQILVAECIRNRVVVAVHFIDNNLNQRMDDLRMAYSTAAINEGNPTQTAAVVRAINTLDTTIPIRTRQRAETDFKVLVYEAIRHIPKGETRTYAQIALFIGTAGAAQNVARVLARNNLAYIIPCHRVIMSGGALGSYRWGEDRKRQLLIAEGYVPTFRDM